MFYGWYIAAAGAGANAVVLGITIFGFGYFATLIFAAMIASLVFHETFVVLALLVFVVRVPLALVIREPVSIFIPLLMGVVFDTRGNYQLAYLAVACFVAIGALCLALIRRTMWTTSAAPDP